MRRERNEVPALEPLLIIDAAACYVSITNASEDPSITHPLDAKTVRDTRTVRGGSGYETPSETIPSMQSRIALRLHPWSCYWFQVILLRD